MRASLIVFLLASAHVLVVCTGRTVDDLEDETDDENWPVLCPPDNYYNKQMENCMPCSGCPLNNIITSPCYRFQDTKCGPFLDFEMGQKIREEDSSEESQEDSKEPGLLFPQTDNDDLDDSDQSSNTGEEGFNKNEANRQWRMVALKMSLIIGGCVALLLVVVIVCIVCIKRRLVREKKLVCEYMPPPGDAAQVIDC